MYSTLRIIVTGLITQHPHLGGITWHHLQYLLGLKRLGHDVYYFEDSGEFPYNLDGGASGVDWIARDCSYNVGYLARIMARFGFEDRWAYHFPLKSRWYGLSAKRRQALIQSADLLINVSGSLEYPLNYRCIPHLLYIDTDPVITQLKIALGNAEFAERVKAHDTHFSFGETLSEGVPATRYRWRPTRQPVVLSEWRPATPPGESFTTVMNWTSYEPLVYAGRTYGQKDVEFKRFLGLPRQLAPGVMEVALSRTQYLKWLGDEDASAGEIGEFSDSRMGRTPFDLVTHAGWRVVDAIEACGDLDTYRHYIESSKAEWSVAKNAYVVGQPGWFSERSACYLAAGRPVVVQDTGFSAVLPVGEGILSFKNLPQAVAGIQEVQADYLRHAQAARALAEAYFDSDKVLTALINDALSDPRPRNEATQRKSTPEIARTSASPRQPAQREGSALHQKTVAKLKTGLLEHPAVQAWVGLCPGPVMPEQIEILKQKSKGAVYRLVGLGPGKSALIAKRCRRERAEIERPVYEEVLPQLPLPAAQYFGSVEEAGGEFWWLFLEDVGDERYSPFAAGHPALAARWLGVMHTAAENLRLKTPLPDRGPDHYLVYLQSARVAIPRIWASPSLRSTDRTILQNIVSMCEYLEANWDQVDTFCEPMPRTFVHGDCLAKNIHVRVTGAGPAVAPFDWGGAGWGLPATDLGQLGLPYRNLPPTDPDYATYLSVVREHWPDFDVQTVQQLANLGQLFWSLKVISRGIPEFDHHGAHIESIMDKFNVYRSVLANAIRAVKWEN
ncbi:MAG TPA: aminoglycoside phosphotransferase family protein [Anaerolineales bacterium]|nr:aminoglycoside phosphotransferase family protein [Anaerolineales bacterium]